MFNQPLGISLICFLNYFLTRLDIMKYNIPMAKTSYLSIDTEVEERYYSDLRPGDRFTIPKIVVKSVLLSRAKSQAIANRSYLKICSALWKAFTDEQRALWKSTDPHPQPHGWRSFVADQSQRIGLDLSGVATPNEYHQDLVGKLIITAPAEEIKIIQPHPHTYYVSQKVAGSKSLYAPVEVEEDFALPLILTINRKSDLTSTGAGSFARIYASIRHLYQGQNLTHDEIIEIPLSSAWAEQTTTISTLIGEAISYNLYIHLYKVTGTLLIDNVKAEHSGQNWVRDTYCKEIEESFNRGFYQVPQHWAPITLPDGAEYGSIYPT